MSLFGGCAFRRDGFTPWRICDLRRNDGVGGETITWYCSYAGTPRSYFESLPPRRIFDSTNGPARAVDSRSESGMTGVGVGIVKRGVMGQVLDPSRGLGMTGGVGGETITWYCSYADTPPLILREPQHERPLLGMGSRYRWAYS